ncbi:MAG: N-acetylmuramoyl-L-alanine amidase [Candidatus Korobacteraceae bacterium]|jgi:N-acetylmuramoyl-L-alanine amidase
MTEILSKRRIYQVVIGAVVVLFAICSSARDTQLGRQQARTQFETAEHMRAALEGKPSTQRTPPEYRKVVAAYRRVYFLSPGSSKADASAAAAADLLAEQGRSFNDEKALRDGISQYEFLRREYPGSKFRFDALFAIGRIYQQDLDEPENAKQVFQDFLKRYPRQRLALEARDAIQEIDAEAARKSRRPQPREKILVERKAAMPLVTGIRYWQTPDYTRVAIDLEAEVKYEAGRIPNPDRIFFDLHETKLAPALVGKSFDVSDGFLRKIRVAQFQKDMARVVLDVDDVSDYSAFLLPNPYRLIIDIHGRNPQKTTVVAKAEAPAAKPKEAIAAPKVAAETKPAAAGAAASDPASAKTLRTTVTTEAAKTAGNKPPENKSPDENAAGKGEANGDANQEQKATQRPTSKPTFQAVAPRVPQKQQHKSMAAEARTAQPTADGERSLTRALGLKFGRIVIDAGHGGHDTGTIAANGLMEKDLVLDVARRLGRLLQTRMGADVVYTRDDDVFVPLENRTAIANQQQADLFISIHANSSADVRARGVETYYLNFTSSADALEVAARENAVSEKSIHELQDLVKKIALRDKIEESREFATNVQSSLYLNLSPKDRGLRDRGVRKAPFIVLIGANMPSILAEISFISNPIDARRLQTPEYRQKIADALYKGITKYVSGLSGVKLAARAKEPAEQ